MYPDRLVDRTKTFMDKSLTHANASNTSGMDTASRRYLKSGHEELTKRLDEKDVNHDVHTRFISATNPDAFFVRYRKSRSKLMYQTYRAVDALCQRSTVVEVTAGGVDETHKMSSHIEAHVLNTDANVTTVVADIQYGTKKNLLACHDKEIKARMPVVKDLYRNTGSRQGIYLFAWNTYEVDYTLSLYV